MKTLLMRVVPIGLLAALALYPAWLSAEPTAWETKLEELGSTEPSIRNAAIAGLAGANSSTVADLLDELVAPETKPLLRGSIVQCVNSSPLLTSHGDVIRYALTTATDASVRGSMLAILRGKPALAEAQLKTILADEAMPLANRCAAGAAMAGLGDAEGVISGLRAVTDAEDAPEALRRTALASLALGSAKGAVWTRRWAEDKTNPVELRRTAVLALGAPGSKAQTELKKLIPSLEVWMRKAAIQTAGTTGNAALLSAVAARLIDPSAGVRLAALRATVSLGGESANKKQIAGLLADADHRVRTVAAEVVGRTETSASAGVITTLKGLLLDANFPVRHAAAMSLLSLGDTSGAATMLADKAVGPASQQAVATGAHTAISAAQN